MLGWWEAYIMVNDAAFCMSLSKQVNIEASAGNGFWFDRGVFE